MGRKADRQRMREAECVYVCVCVRETDRQTHREMVCMIET